MKYGRFLQVSILGLALCSTSLAQVTRRMSVSSSEHQANGHSSSPSISADGLCVAFESVANDVVGGDSNGAWDVFCREWLNGQSEIASVDTSSALGNTDSRESSTSADGRYVAFYSDASNLVAGDTNGKSDIFVRDRAGGVTQRVSVSSAGAEANGHSSFPSISADGRYVAFLSIATNLVSGDTLGFQDVFVRDRLSGVTVRASLNSGEAQANGHCHAPALSADGRFVAFASDATNLIGPLAFDTNGLRDVFRRDLVNGGTARVSVTWDSQQTNEISEAPSISADGQLVAFHSYATNLTAGDTNGVADVFLRDLSAGTTVRVSYASNGAQGNGHSQNPSISGDGRFVAFSSLATNLVSSDTNGDTDVFVRDRTANTTERVSVDSGGSQADGDSQSPSISSDGRFVAFYSAADDLVPGDTNDAGDIFLRDRNASGFTSVCHPGVGGVIACPCGNPPSAAGRGCNNSSNTGGAFLTASGLGYLSMDSLVFTTFGEKPVALSILLQGNASVAAGAVYGQGVRCAGGSLKRLFVKIASSGSIVAPGAGDPTISARSAAKGDTIQAGQKRHYLVYYRDPNVLGGCPTSSTFNATQTGRVTWVQ